MVAKGKICYVAICIYRWSIVSVPVSVCSVHYESPRRVVLKAKASRANLYSSQSHLILPTYLPNAKLCSKRTTRNESQQVKVKVEQSCIKQATIHHTPRLPARLPARPSVLPSFHPRKSHPIYYETIMRTPLHLGSCSVHGGGG